ncbi:SusF/SusE family outer membrane protein [Labilibaculum sp. DW002]|uniref:SusF/SusE family outer membrane protein n=1 Tax=Paralabilibaculum antarcticum TaxID=2912572 RepID=A0ABT5VVG5_9BACT|nr:SusF/SusE family outer membrane protein [Labilibaculum sp. DW002]MDE5419411.1 SusF/SusE family outer membrane protein [Labilibaculum sp. DW002]
MKNNIITKLLGLAFITLFVVFVGCDKDDLIKLDAEMATWKNDGITSTSVLLSGIVVAEGEGIAEYGVVWGLNENPTTADSKKVADKVEKAVYWITVDGLENLTVYNYRAYVITVDGNTIYGENDTFSTLANIATVTATDATGITDIFAQIAVNVPYDGKAEVTSKGVCWNTELTPTIENDTTLNGKGIGEFTADLTGLLPNTMYYARAYAVNSVGIAYSSEVSFTTTIGVPVLTTDSVRDITKTEANVYGNVIVTGGVDITERGFVYSMTENPTTADTKIVDAANTTGEMTAALSGLASGKAYHVRAFATNSEGTAYGDNINFSTLSDITTWYVPGGYVAASYPGTTFADWSPADSPYVMNTVDNPTTLEGFVYMATANNEWKFASQPNWDGPNYGEGANAGELDASGGNFQSPAGYYKLNVDMSTTPMTYTAVSTDWGVIGDASPGGWDTDTNLSYDAATQTWRGTVHLAGGSFKFRANDGWDINYGSSTANEVLNAGGDNIANDVEADYDITLDLSTPNTYTYSANRWGLIGDATPGGWDTDTDMTWDATNSVFTATLDLTGGGSYKFRANDGWDVNLGGALDGLTPGGDNLAITEDGNYTITLNTMTNVATVTKN